MDRFKRKIPEKISEIVIPEGRCTVLPAAGRVFGVERCRNLNELRIEDTLLASIEAHEIGHFDFPSQFLIGHNYRKLDEQDVINVFNHDTKTILIPLQWERILQPLKPSVGQTEKDRWTQEKVDTAIMLAVRPYKKTIDMMLIVFGILVIEIVIATLIILFD